MSSRKNKAVARKVRETLKPQYPDLAPGQCAYITHSSGKKVKFCRAAING